LQGTRTIQKGIDAKQQILNEIGKDKADLIEPVEIDLSTLQKVRDFAELFRKRADTKLNILINNAGIQALKKRYTADGFEENFGINYLAHFLLTLLLLPFLEDTARLTGIPPRIVHVSSESHRMVAEVDFEDWSMEKVEFETHRAYGISKLGNLLFSRELNEINSKKKNNKLKLRD